MITKNSDTHKYPIRLRTSCPACIAYTPLSVTHITDARCAYINDAAVQIPSKWQVRCETSF